MVNIFCIKFWLKFVFPLLTMTSVIENITLIKESYDTFHIST